MKSELVSMAESGMSVARIAEELAIAENTVKMTLSTHLRKEQELVEHKEQFVKDYALFTALLGMNNHLSGGTYTPPKHVAKFISDNLTEVMSQYERDLKPATVMRHMYDTLEILKIDNEFLKRSNTK